MVLIDFYLKLVSHLFSSGGYTGIVTQVLQMEQVGTREVETIQVSGTTVRVEKVREKPWAPRTLALPFSLLLLYGNGVQVFENSTC